MSIPRWVQTFDADALPWLVDHRPINTSAVYLWSQIRQSEVVQPVTTVDCANDRKQSLMVRDWQFLPCTVHPTPWREMTRKGTDCANE